MDSERDFMRLLEDCYFVSRPTWRTARAFLQSLMDAQGRVRMTEGREFRVLSELDRRGADLADPAFAGLRTILNVPRKALASRNARFYQYEVEPMPMFHTKKPSRELQRLRNKATKMAEEWDETAQLLFDMEEEERWKEVEAEDNDKRRVAQEKKRDEQEKQCLLEAGWAAAARFRAGEAYRHQLCEAARAAGPLFPVQVAPVLMAAAPVEPAVPAADPAAMLVDPTAVLADQPADPAAVLADQPAVLADPPADPAALLADQPADPAAMLADQPADPAGVLADPPAPPADEEDQVGLTPAQLEHRRFHAQVDSRMRGRVIPGPTNLRLEVVASEASRIINQQAENGTDDNTPRRRAQLSRTIEYRLVQEGVIEPSATVQVVCDNWRGVLTDNCGLTLGWWQDGAFFNQVDTALAGNPP
jgi:hypothetical protein